MTPDISAFLRNHISELCRCAELERKLHYMQFEMKRNNIYVRPLTNEPPALPPHDMNAYEVGAALGWVRKNYGYVDYFL